MAPRKTYDWEAIEREYRAGQLSIREIGKRNGCSDTAIRKKAKVNGWKRDLIKKVNREVRNKLVRGEVRSDAPSEHEIVEAASSRVVDVLHAHREQISKGREIVDVLLEQLLSDGVEREKIEEIIEEETQEEENANRRKMLKAVSLQSHSSMAVSLSIALKNFISLERQAYSLNDGDEGTDSKLSDIIDAIDGKTRGLPND